MEATEGRQVRACYLVQWRQEPDPRQLELLARLLDATAEPPDAGGERIYIAPATGTESIWSNQATRIAISCGISSLGRVERGSMHACRELGASDSFAWYNYDPMLHQRHASLEDMVQATFAAAQPQQDEHVTPAPEQDGVSMQGIKAANQRFNMGLDERKMEWIAAHYDGAPSSPSPPASRHQPTISELMTFAQFHSEHCRHNTFRAPWHKDGSELPPLFDLIRGTTEASGHNILSAYRDNAAVARSYQGAAFHPDQSGRYRRHRGAMHTVMKVETHNHPTAICPQPGAATGAGGELRDEAATGRGAKPLAGMVGYCTSSLKLDDEGNDDTGYPLASALNIMCHAPLGAADYNNEFGRPVLCGYFRTFTQRGEDGRRYGYHKPIMIAGGHGVIAEAMVAKRQADPGQLLLLLGSPALRVGIGGGSASSDSGGGEGKRQSDFNSVQRGHAEIQRRAQEVINRCWQMGADNPILSIHDVGAGGIANAIPELLDGHGMDIDVAAIPVADKSMNALERWCNESQERFVLTIAPESEKRMLELCAREQVPCATLGTISGDDVLRLHGQQKERHDYIETSMRWLHTPMPEPARQLLETGSENEKTPPYPKEELGQLIEETLRHPTVADKGFLVTIGDRSVGGLTAREQLVGPWQVAVSDCAVSAHDYDAFTGTAMAVGERAASACIDAAASARMAVAEAIGNISAARVLRIGDITLSANWMAAAGERERESELYAAVKAACELCRELGIPIPVGKDSLSMRSRWQGPDKQMQEVTSPLTLVVTAFAQVADIRETMTPQIHPGHPLLLLQAKHGHNRLGGSILRQISSETCMREAVPDCDAETIGAMFSAIQNLNDGGYLMAYHDRSDGGLISALCEMAFAGRCGLDIQLQPQDAIPQLFSEEIGAIVQVPQEHHEQIMQSCAHAGLQATVIATATADDSISIQHDGKAIYREQVTRLRSVWSETQGKIRLRRGDDPTSVQSELKAAQQKKPMLFDSPDDREDKDAAKAILDNRRPLVAVLREQGTNGNVEMAAAFTMAGFDCHDIHMSDLASGKAKLERYQALAIPGGFSYGDVLGAGRGWGMSILQQPQLQRQFQDFFERTDTLTLGLCNGCQVLACLKELIPGSAGWEELAENKSRRFEGRTVMVKVADSPSKFFKGMEGWQLPVPVAHGEGRMVSDKVGKQCLHYVDAEGQATMEYPANPAGSSGGIAGLCSEDGRVTILMPHPERAFLNWQLSWRPPSWRGKESPWLQMFRNAHVWVEHNQEGSNKS